MQLNTDIKTPDFAGYKVKNVVVLAGVEGKPVPSRYAAKYTKYFKGKDAREIFEPDSLFFNDKDAPPYSRTFFNIDTATLIVYLRQMPKPEPKPKKPATPTNTRVASQFAGALMTAKTKTDERKLTLKAKAVLLALSQFLPKGEEYRGIVDAAPVERETLPARAGSTPPPQPTEEQAQMLMHKQGVITLHKDDVKKLASLIYGRDWGGRVPDLMKSLIEGTQSVSVDLRSVEEEVKMKIKGKMQTVRKVTTTTHHGSLIQLDVTQAKLYAQEGVTIEDLPEPIAVGYSGVFCYWINRYYRNINLPDLMQKSRQAGGEEYMLMTLWATDNMPQIAQALKSGSGYSAVFRYPIEENAYTAKDMRKRVKDHADTIAKEIGATGWQEECERTQSGQNKAVGIRFWWGKTDPQKGDIQDV